jgi:hypothetical protein
MDASLEVEGALLTAWRPPRRENDTTGCLPPACPVSQIRVNSNASLTIQVNSNASLTIQQVKIYLRHQLTITTAGQAVQVWSDRERSEPRRTHASAMN